MRARLSPLHYFGQREALIDDLWVLIGDKKYQRLHDLCSGSGSIAFAAMLEHKADSFVLNDSFPLFKDLWYFIKAQPGKVIAQFSKMVAAYVEDKNYYQQVIKQLKQNERRSQDDLLQAAVSFAFIINLSEDHVPLFNSEKHLSCAPDVRLTNDEILERAEDFRTHVVRLSATLENNNFTAMSGDFISYLDAISPEDIVILDPPYPGQSRDIYFNLSSGEKLFQDLSASLASLSVRHIPVVILFGANVVPLQDQFTNPALGLQHLVRHAWHPKFGDYLEHIYISQSLFDAIPQLPAHIGRYEGYFNVNEEMTIEGCKGALDKLKEGQHESIRYAQL